MPGFHKASAGVCCPPADLAGRAGEAAGSRKNSRGLLIINADDWGGWPGATDAARVCFAKGRITSVSAMVFMEDSERAAALAKDLGVDAGLHFNLTQSFTGGRCPAPVAESLGRVRRFLKRSKYALLVYHPFLRKEFRCLYQAQAEEFERLYGRPPSHIDGHQHMHLGTNVLVDGILPAGQKVRRSFSFWPGEKSALNRSYRRWVDGRLARRHGLTQYFFALSQCLRGPRLARVGELAAVASVELMTHPEKPDEQAFLLSEACRNWMHGLPTGTYAKLSTKPNHE